VGFVLNKPSAAERELIDRAIAKSLRAMDDVMAGRQEDAVRYLHSKQE
jgi:aminoacyl-tRNA hydrolase